MASYYKACAKADVPQGQGKAVTIEGQAIAVFNVEGTFHAIEDTCCHAGGPLSEGSIDGDQVICPWHGWEFELGSGECATSPGYAQKKYAVKLEGDDILIAIES